MCKNVAGIIIYFGNINFN